MPDLLLVVERALKTLVGFAEFVGDRVTEIFRTDEEQK